MSKYKKFTIEHPKHEAIEDQAEISEASYLPFSSVSSVSFSKRSLIRAMFETSFTWIWSKLFFYVLLHTNRELINLGDFIFHCTALHVRVSESSTWRHSQVVRQRIANPLSPGSTPGAASRMWPHSGWIADKGNQPFNGLLSFLQFGNPIFNSIALHKISHQFQQVAWRQQKSSLHNPGVF